MRRLLLLFVLFSAVNLLYAQDWDTEKTAYQEKWYTYWGIGGSSLTYLDQDSQDDLKRWEDAEYERLTVAMDLLGIYIPVTQKMIVGVIVNCDGDRYQYQYDETNWFQLNYYTWSFSGIYFPSQFGRGLFLRADGGIATNNYQDGEGLNINNSENGIGVLVGGGLSFDFGGTRLMLNLNTSYRKIGDLEMKSVGITLGGLF